MPAPGEKENDGADDIFSKFSIEDVEDMLNR